MATGETLGVAAGLFVSGVGRAAPRELSSGVLGFGLATGVCLESSGIFNVFSGVSWGVLWGVGESLGVSAAFGVTLGVS